MKEAISAAANTSRAIATGELGEISKYVDTKQKNVAELPVNRAINAMFQTSRWNLRLCVSLTVRHNYQLRLPRR